MDITQPLALLGGISPKTFMARYWQKKPLLIRQAIARFRPLLDRAELFELAAKEAVESRLIAQKGGAGKSVGKRAGKGEWQLKAGPFVRRALPALKTPGWTLLVQGVDLHHDAVRALLDRFRFVPDARLDDLMISYAAPGGGVGPHFDSYDVFLLQAQGRRQWSISRQKDLTLQPDAPLKILADFQSEETFVLEPGDMLYLPPRYAHDGVALEECMTYSIGFRAPGRGELAGELLQRLAEDAMDEAGAALYQDAAQAAVSAPGEMPPELIKFAQAALQKALGNPTVLQRALGECLSEPKASVWFEDGTAASPLRISSSSGLRLDRRTKMLFDDRHVFINGESYAASGRDALLMRRFANERRLQPETLQRASEGAKSLLCNWLEAGWIHEC